MIETLEAQFRIHEMSPGMWFVSAFMLKRSADILYLAYVSDIHKLGTDAECEVENLGVGGSATMLYGLAIENAAKGLIVRSLEVGSRPKWNRKPAHDLESLLIQAQRPCSAKQLEILPRLSAFVRWAGRYPTPLDSKDYAIEQAIFPRPTQPIPLLPHEKPIVDELFDGLVSSIQEEAPD